jgi:hypothetical protein
VANALGVHPIVVVDRLRNDGVLRWRSALAKDALTGHQTGKRRGAALGWPTGVQIVDPYGFGGPACLSLIKHYLCQALTEYTADPGPVSAFRNLCSSQSSLEHCQ